jgi:eukaryotic-like serine/threonine-protein kinase
LNCLSEETILAYAEGRLAPAALTEVEGHTRGCATCRELLSLALVGDRVTQHAVASGQAVARSAGEHLARGAPLGRYTVLALVGRGGMGEVYSAYDAELDRRIALKLLHSERGASDVRAQGRLLREARAMARLSHRNVIAVHDAGTISGRVFVAMEFVDGGTVKEWLAAAPRSRAEILETFASAARGLAAAHASGMVHRDFKPHNVMVGKDGSVRVLDFGLARRLAEPEVAEAPGETLAPLASRDEGGLTSTGELVGTPLYMAPEQFRGESIDARTDQFSFCVALHEALYGVHPFAGATLPALMTNVLAGRVVAPPPGHDVPSWLRRVLLRGLRVDRAERWTSMEALLGALERDPLRTRRRWAAALGVAVLVIATVTAVVRATGRAESICRGGPARLAGIWESPGAPAVARPRREAVHAAFLKTGLSTANEIWGRVAPLLDAYAARWLSMYSEACEATQVREKQSVQTLDLRMSCLDQRRTALGALTDVLGSADRVAVMSAVDAVDALPTVDRCADLDALRAVVEPPRDEATRQRVADLQRRAAVAKALNDTGKFIEALSRARALVKEARLVNYDPLLAELLGLEGRFEDGSSFRPEAVDLLEEAVWTAIAVGRDDVAAEAGGLLVGYTGYYLGRSAEGWRWARMTTALLDRMGSGHDLLRAWLLHAEGNLKMQAHDLQGALELFQQAFLLKERSLPPDHPDLSATLAAIAETEHRLGRNDEALRLNERAIVIEQRGYGATAEQLAPFLNNKGEYLIASGRARDAIPIFRDALARWEPPGAPRTVTLGYPLTGLGRALLEVGRASEAVPVLERALVRREAGEPDQVLVAETRFALGRALVAAGADRSRARKLIEEARVAYQKAADGEHVRTIDAWLASDGTGSAR